jgi:hypothetical protein
MNISHNSIVPVDWSDVNFNSFDWVETYMIDEVPSNDKWDTIATENKLKLEQLYIKHNLPKECSKHYMCFSPKLQDELADILKSFDGHIVYYNFLKITPGYNVWMHYDSYSTFIKHNKIDSTDISNINRTAIFMTEGAAGQVFQLGSDVHYSWEKGKAFTWKGATWHGAANFGFEDLIVMQVTWL